MSIWKTIGCVLVIFWGLAVIVRSIFFVPFWQYDSGSTVAGAAFAVFAAIVFASWCSAALVRGHRAGGSLD